MTISAIIPKYLMLTPFEWKNSLIEAESVGEPSCLEKLLIKESIAFSLIYVARPLTFSSSYLISSSVITNFTFLKTFALKITGSKSLINSSNFELLFWLYSIFALNMFCFYSSDNSFSSLPSIISLIFCSVSLFNSSSY